MSEGLLRGKKALVTGGGTGIGKACAQCLARMLFPEQMDRDFGAQS